MTLLRNVVVRPKRSVSRPSSQTPSSTSKTSGAGLLDLVEQHARRTAAAGRGGSGRSARRAAARAAARRRRSRRTRSCRAGSGDRRAASPGRPPRRGRRRRAARARASSVLPTPVGPQNSSTPSGRCGSFSPALNVVTSLRRRPHRLVLADHLAPQRGQQPVAVERHLVAQQPARAGRSGGRSWATTSSGVTAGRGRARAWRSHRSRRKPAAGPGNDLVRARSGGTADRRGR